MLRFEPASAFRIIAFRGDSETAGGVAELRRRNGHWKATFPELEMITAEELGALKTELNRLNGQGERT